MKNTKSKRSSYLRLAFLPLIFLLGLSAANGRETQVLYTGDWKSNSFSTTLKGSWQIVREDETTYVKMGDNFEASGAPDLKIFLSKLPLDDITGDNAAEGNTSVRVAKLKTFHGKSTYVIPDDVAIEDYKSVVIHCEAYSKLWGGSPLSAFRSR